MTDPDRALWLTVRRALLMIVAAFDRKYDVKSKHDVG